MIKRIWPFATPFFSISLVKPIIVQKINFVILEEESTQWERDFKLVCLQTTVVLRDFMLNQEIFLGRKEERHYESLKIRKTCY